MKRIIQLGQQKAKQSWKLGVGLAFGISLVLAGCQDVAGLGDVGSNPGTTSATDTVAPVVSVSKIYGSANQYILDAALTAGPLRMQNGDSVEVMASDSTGLAEMGFILKRGEKIVYNSALYNPTSKTSDSHWFKLNNLASNFPYGEELSIRGYAKDKAGNLTTSDIFNNGANPIIVGMDSQIKLGTGAFSDLAIDYQNKYLYFTNPSENSVGYINLKTFVRGSTDMSPGSRPTNLSVVTQGLFGGSQLVVFAAGSRDFAVFNISTGPQSGSPLLRSDPALADVDSVSQSGVATSLVRLPTTSTSSIFTACGLTSCTLFAGMTGAVTSNSVLQKIDLSQASQNPGFDILSPDVKFPSTDPTNVLAGVDKAVNLRALAVDPLTGQRSQIFYRSDRSLCASVYGEKIVSGIRPDAQGPIYLRSNAAGCNLPIIRLDPTANGWDLSTTAAVQVVRESRYSSINGILVSPAGSKVIVRTDATILVADPDLRVRGELPPESAPTGAGFLIGSSVITDGQWVAVAFANKVVIYDTNTFRPVAQFSTASTMTNKLIFLPVGTGATDKVVILGLNADNTILLKIETSIAEIKNGAGL